MTLSYNIPTIRKQGAMNAGMLSLLPLFNPGPLAHELVLPTFRKGPLTLLRNSLRDVPWDSSPR